MVVCASCGAPVETVPGGEAVGAACPACGRSLHATPDRLHPAGTVMAELDTAERPAVLEDHDHTVIRPLTTPVAAAAPVAPLGPRPTGPPPGWTPTTPPPADRVPGRARYPLYADEPRTVVAAPPPAPTVGAASPAVSSGPPPPTRRRRRRVVWGAVAVVVVLLAAGGLLLWDGRADTPNPLDATDSPGAGAPSGGPSDGDGDGQGDPKPSDQGDQGDDKDGKKDGKGGSTGAPPEELVGTATLTVPGTAKPSQDEGGQKVRYDATNMLDGDAATCWREPGDGAGEVIVITFPEPVRLTSVGMVNGYAKTAGSLDWYNGNRRIQKAEWVLDDGTVVEQPLDRDRDVQTVPVDEVRTRTVRLRLEKVSKPGQGKAGRDYTAISELSLIGTTD